MIYGTTDGMLHKHTILSHNSGGRGLNGAMKLFTK